LFRGALRDGVSLDDPARGANLVNRLRRMIRLRWILIGLLVLPIAELAVFLVVAAQIGLVQALAIVLATSLAGALIVRNAAGKGGSASSAPGESAARDGGSIMAFRIVAGMLLLVPGFLTDIAAMLLLIPALQRRILNGALRGFGLVPEDHARTIELTRGEWRRVPETEPGTAQKAHAASHCPPTPPVLATPPESGNSASRVEEEP
jgi:UPF0716 protein FxsA